MSKPLKTANDYVKSLAKWAALLDYAIADFKLRYIDPPEKK